LCQHILIRACAGPFHADDLYGEVTRTGAYAALTRADFDDCLTFCATGGYALRAYDKWKRLLQTADGQWQLRDPRAAQRIRMNIGTIQDTDTVKVRLKGNFKPLGEIEEAFAATLTPGDTFLIGGQIVRYDSMRELSVQVTRDAAKTPKIATFMGTKFATSTQLQQRILRMFQQATWPELPSHTAEWLALQREISKLPTPNRLLVETFAFDERAYLNVYGFAGRNAQQTLGLLLTFEHWLSGNAVMKKTFRTSATIAGLIERNLPQARKSGRQATFSSDILYDTLSKYEPDHLILQITREEALRGLVDFGRITEMLTRTQGRIDHVALDRIPPLAAPMLLERGKVSVAGSARERLMEDTAALLMEHAGLSQLPQ